MKALPCLPPLRPRRHAQPEGLFSLFLMFCCSLFYIFLLPFRSIPSLCRFICFLYINKQIFLFCLFSLKKCIFPLYYKAFCTKFLVFAFFTKKCRFSLMPQSFSGKNRRFCIFSGFLPVFPYLVRLFKEKSANFVFFSKIARFPLPHKAF